MHTGRRAPRADDLACCERIHISPEESRKRHSLAISAWNGTGSGIEAKITVLQLPIRTSPQPDENSCGPTCLHAIYRYWGEEEPLHKVVERLQRPPQRGTFAVFLACDALRKGYCATIYTYNLMVFDPSWFADKVNIAERLRRQREVKTDARLQLATEGYLDFLALGGRLRFADLCIPRICSILRRKLPIVTGLSATFLYRASREYGNDDTPDDIRGVPSGHFVVMAGYDPVHRRVLIADPYKPNPYGPSHEYWINADRVVNAVLLGIVTHDANLLVIYPSPAGNVP